MRQELMDRVQAIMNKAMDYRNSFDNYSYLWVDDRNEFMRQFLLYNHVLTAEEIEAHADEGVPENPPTLAQFKEQVESLQLALICTPQKKQKQNKNKNKTTKNKQTNKKPRFVWICCNKTLQVG